MNRDRILIRLFFVVSILALACVSCEEGGGCAKMFGARKGGVPVVVEKVKFEETSPIVVVGGKLAPSDKSVIQYLNDVKVSEVYVKVGDTVLKDDRLFKISEDEINNELNFAKARRFELEAVIEKNANLLRERQRMSEEGKVDNEEIVRLEKGNAAEEAELERIKAEIVKLTYNLEHAVVGSPIAGIITKRDVSPGSLARAGETLISIVNVNPIVVTFELDSKQSENIAVGTVLNIFINEIPDKKFSANVTYIGPEIHRTDKTFEVWASIPNDEGLLKAGMQATTEFVSDVQRYTFTVPISAVMSKDSRPYVFKVSRGIARRTNITIGSVSDLGVGVIRGLERDDIVVIKGGENLTDGADVTIWTR